jgi:hypothetical protein
VGIGYKIDSLSTFTIEYQGSHANVGVDIFSDNKVYANQVTQYEVSTKGVIGITNNSLIGNYKR